MSTMEVVPVRDTQLVRAEDFMPVLSVKQAVERKHMVNEFIAGVMTEGEDYGKIPGGQQKRVLLKPGAEKLSSIFGMSPRYELEERTERWGEDGREAFFYYRYTCKLYRGDRMMGEAAGSCNSWESKYRWRSQDRLCHKCGAAAIIKGKQEYGGGFICFGRKGGCGAKFTDDDPAIIEQKTGKVPNPDVADQVNTVLKMAQKRALIAAVLVVTNCSDAFTQDIEDQIESAPAHQQPSKPVEPDLPEPLRKVFEGLNRPGAVKEALEMMRVRLDAVMPANGEEEYRRILADHGIVPGGGKPAIGTLKLAMLQMYEVAEFARQQKEKSDA